MMFKTPPASSPTRQAKPRLVVVGNGMAGMRTVEELLKLAPDLYDITVSAPSRTATTTASC
jgi:nitrite reductase (NADH) large subunit